MPPTLALEGRFEDFTIGKEISLERVKEITKLAHFHGSRWSGFRTFERQATDAQTEHVRTRAGRTQEAKWANPVC